MKTLFALFLFSAASLNSFGQVINNYTITVNDDTKSLNAALENKMILLNFQKSDVLTIQFSDLVSDMTDKTIEIQSESDKKVFTIETFGSENISENNDYATNISFDKLIASNSKYFIEIKDKTGRQKLITFKVQ